LVGTGFENSIDSGVCNEDGTRVIDWLGLVLKIQFIQVFAMKTEHA
jgi:hypothetical protein